MPMRVLRTVTMLATILLSTPAYSQTGAMTPAVPENPAAQFSSRGVPPAEYRRRLAARSWAMENLGSGVAWDAAELERRLGPSERRLHIGTSIVSYYYSDVDLTVYMSVAQNEVLLCRPGRSNITVAELN
jgi:hypothetical protein